ncbi:MAG TPA: citrate/2-methylcitrate synthase [Mycobacteriales bacterium]|nr:citrate/2-methylcitrate synthase [Mycobacteriales bacterium]
MAERATKGLADIVAASTAISDIDGRAGVLSYRGYDIHELAGRTTFEEVAHLLQRGSLPTRDELDRYRAELAAARTTLGPTVERILPAVAGSSPMEALRTLVSVLSVDDPDAADSTPAADLRKAARLVGQLPVLVARYHAARSGRPVPDPDPDLDLAGNLLFQLTGQRPDRTRTAMLDECLVLYADHTMNASTFTARICAATLADLYAAATAALATLSGPLHGGANEAVMHMLEGIPDVDAVPGDIQARLGRGEKIMGFGHRVYRTEDPRVTHLRAMSGRLAELVGEPRYRALSARIEQVVAEVKGLRPNGDFYAASVYHYLGIPTDLFSPVFAVARIAGWTAHAIEQHQDNRLIRPDSEYVGPKRQYWMPLAERG